MAQPCVSTVDGAMVNILEIYIICEKQNVSEKQLMYKIYNYMPVGLLLQLCEQPRTTIHDVQ